MPRRLSALVLISFLHRFFQRIMDGHLSISWNSPSYPGRPDGGAAQTVLKLHPFIYIWAVSTVNILMLLSRTVPLLIYCIERTFKFSKKIWKLSMLTVPRASAHQWWPGLPPIMCLQIGSIMHSAHLINESILFFPLLCKILKSLISLIARTF